MSSRPTCPRAGRLLGELVHSRTACILVPPLAVGEDGSRHDSQEPEIVAQHESPDALVEFAELIRDERESLVGESASDRAARRARRRRGWIVATIVFIVVLAAGGGYAGWALTAPLAAPRVESQPPPLPSVRPATLALPAEGAAAVTIAGADDYFGAAASGLSLTSGTDEPRPIASISKLITALVVLDAKPLSTGDPGPTIVFDKAAHDLYDKYYVQGATIAPMPTGSSMTEHDALATMLIPSASNYAEAISTWALGSQSAFLRATRAWLAAHGLGGTTIVEPTGISSRNTSTPSDLLTIAGLAASHPVIAEIASTTSLWLATPGELRNTNDLLGTDGITGLKTGNLGEGTFNLLYTATLDVDAVRPLTVTGVRLGGFSHDSVNRDVLALLDSIRAGFHDMKLATAGQEVGSYSTPWGSTARIVIGENASIFTWSDTPITVSLELKTPDAYADGEVVGTLTWTAGPNTATAPVEIQGSIVPPTASWRLTHPGELARR